MVIDVTVGSFSGAGFGVSAGFTASTTFGGSITTFAGAGVEAMALPPSEIIAVTL